jgi:hypothetical protein
VKEKASARSGRNDSVVGCANWRKYSGWVRELEEVTTGWVRELSEGELEEGAVGEKCSAISGGG